MKIFLISVGWCILGLIVAFIIVWPTGLFEKLPSLSKPSALLNPLPSITAIQQIFLTAVVALTVGGTISFLGVITTFLKYSAELSATKVKTRKEPVLSFHTTTSPRHEAAASAFYQSTMACQTCGTQNPTSSKYCENCGNRFPSQSSLWHVFLRESERCGKIISGI